MNKLQQTLKSTKIRTLLIGLFFITQLPISAENYALKLNQQSTIQLTTNVEHNTKQWTVEMWVNKAAQTNHATILNGSYSKLNLETWKATYKIGYTNKKATPADQTFNYQLPTNKWVHIAYVQNQQQLILYVNGQEIEAKNVVLPLPLKSIGVKNETFVGLIDEIRVWKTARTQQELSNNMNHSIKQTNDKNLLAYWYFDDTQTQITDLSHNGLSGKIENATYQKNTNQTFQTTLPTMKIEEIVAQHQNEYLITPGAKKQELLMVNIKTSGVENPLYLNEININTIGTTNIADLTNIQIYNTGNSKIFATNQFYGTQSKPNTRSNIIKGDTKLTTGNNYFWIAADINPTAKIEHIVDAGLEYAIVNQQKIVPKINNPVGKRLIANKQTTNQLPYNTIIPRPVDYKTLEGEFLLDKETQIVVTEQTNNEGQLLAEFLRQATGYPLTITKTETTNAIILQIDKQITNSSNKEAYQIDINPKRIILKGVEQSGVFLATQTLRQMLPAQIEKSKTTNDIKWSVPAAKIVDYPRFEYRGMMFDVGRHIYSIDYLKRYIDYLALYKYNVFHWHLTEDQGWRIEIKKYPKLQQIAAWRDCNGERYGGYYTQKQVKELIDYAQKRHIEIIPEIEFPGHSVEILAAYPAYACTSTQPPFHVRCDWGISNEVVCGGKDETLQFYKNIFDEIIELFPSKYIHIGGDEAPKHYWKTCDDCQNKIKQLKLTGNKEEALQYYLMEKLGEYLKAKGKEFIGWSEMAHSGKIPTGAILQDWIGGTDLALKKGHKVIRSSYTAIYLSQRQSDNPEEPKGPAQINTLEEVYHYEPIPTNASKEQEKLILGPEACIWTEHIKTEKHFDYMSSPRIQAHAEVAWTQKRLKHWQNFNSRMLAHYMRLDQMGLNYRRIDNNRIIYHKLQIKEPTVIDAGINGLSYYWNDENTSKTKKITISKPGIYKCYVNYFGIQKTVIFEVTNPTNVNEIISQHITLHISPNPAKENLTINIQLHKGNNATIQIVDTNGKKYFEEQVQQNHINKTISTKHYTKGIYIVIVKNEYGKTTQKLIIQ